MPVSIRDAQHSAGDRAWIQNHYAAYLEDLSRLSMNTGMFPAAGEWQYASMLCTCTFISV